MSTSYTLPKSSFTNDGSKNSIIINLPENANYTSSPIPKTTLKTVEPVETTLSSSSSSSSSNNIMYMIIGIIICLLLIMSSIGFYFIKK